MEQRSGSQFRSPLSEIVRLRVRRRRPVDHLLVDAAAVSWGAGPLGEIGWNQECGWCGEVSVPLHSMQGCIGSLLVYALLWSQIAYLCSVHSVHGQAALRAALRLVLGAAVYSTTGWCSGYKPVAVQDTYICMYVLVRICIMPPLYHTNVSRKQARWPKLVFL